MLHFTKRDESIQGVMQSHRGNEWSREVSAHFPIDANRFAGSGPANKPFDRGEGQITCPLCVFMATHDESRLTQGMHPFCEIVKILTVTIPLQLFLNDLI